MAKANIIYFTKEDINKSLSLYENDLEDNIIRISEKN